MNARPRTPLFDNLPGSWADDALCAQTNPEEFFPERGASNAHARAICRACPVRAECLAYALANDEQFGIWAGTTPEERHAIRRGTATGYCGLDGCHIATVGDRRYCSRSHAARASSARRLGRVS